MKKLITSHQLAKLYFPIFFDLEIDRHNNLLSSRAQYAKIALAKYCIRKVGSICASKPVKWVQQVLCFEYHQIASFISSILQGCMFSAKLSNFIITFLQVALCVHEKFSSESLTTTFARSFYSLKEKCEIGPGFNIFFHNH